MKMINRKRLNNKGFTLIELLAVVVVLAIVMGIATTSVLSAMNKSKGGSLRDSAMVIANAFNQKYTESLVDGESGNVYGDVLGTGYNFQNTATYTLSSGLANTFNISDDDYALASSIAAITDATAQSDSTVSFDATTGKFIVCLAATSTGSFYVNSFAGEPETNIVVDSGTSAKLTFGNNTMYACSNGDKSWSN